MRNHLKNLSLSILIFVLAFFAFSGFSHTSEAGQTAEKKEIITLPGVDLASRPFSPAVKFGNLLFLSGVVGIDQKTNELVSPDVGEQTKQCLELLGYVLKQAEMDYSDVVSCTVYLSDLEDYAAMNKSYMAYFPENRPSRACVQVAGLVRGAKVEISMIAAK